MSELDCILKITDEHDVEHRVRVKASSVYDAALTSQQRLKKSGWEGDCEQRRIVVEIWDVPTTHVVSVEKLFRWLKGSGKSPPEDARKQKLRRLANVK